MYEQIIQILEKNYLPSENIFYRDLEGNYIFNDNEEWKEYSLVQDNDQAYLWLLQGDNERYFTIIAGAQLPNGILFYTLREEYKEEIDPAHYYVEVEESNE